MSWVGIASNQGVSFNNLQDAVNNGYFTALTTIPVSAEQITKTDASTYVNCDTSYGPFAAKASNQLVVKSNLVTTTTTTTNPIYVYCAGYDVSDCCDAQVDYNLNCNNNN